MFFGASKTIYIISPQPWDGLPVSKHHYASELATLGHQVYFIEPPHTERMSSDITVRPTETRGVSSVAYGLPFPYALKFRWRGQFDYQMRRQARRLVDAIGAAPDLVWDFDNAYQFADLAAFGPALKLFHLMDAPPTDHCSNKNADMVLSVSQAFLDKIRHPAARKRLVPHGLNRAHEAYARRALAGSADRRVQERPVAAYVGNLSAAGLDWDTLFEIIDRNPGVEFRLIGPHEDRTALATRLRTRPNCTAMGTLPAEEILAMAAEVDVWLACYAPLRTENGAENAHKILEYLATGKAVLANRMAAYEDSHLVYGAASPGNEDMPERLARLVGARASINAPRLQRERAAHALDHAYRRHLRTITEPIQPLCAPA
ncbi:MAG: hypothetical protein AAFX03_03180 [Pseudomonadota bacterium]